jgi:hypothetical protein
VKQDVLASALVGHHDRGELRIGAQEWDEQAVHGHRVVAIEQARLVPRVDQLEIPDDRTEEMAKLELDLADRLLQDHSGEPLDGFPRAEEGQGHDRAGQQHDHQGEVPQQALVDGYGARVSARHAIPRRRSCP